MKAREYVNGYNKLLASDGEKVALAFVLGGLMRELIELSQSRGANSEDAALSCFDEINNKWNAFTRIVPIWNNSGFETFVKAISPELYDIICSLRVKRSRQKELRMAMRR